MQDDSRRRNRFGAEVQLEATQGAKAMQLAQAKCTPISSHGNSQSGLGLVKTRRGESKTRVESLQALGMMVVVAIVGSRWRKEAGE